MTEDIPMCVIHSTADDLGSYLILLRDLAYWNSHVKVTRIKQHQHLLNDAESLLDGQLQQVHYHPNTKRYSL